MEIANNYVLIADDVELVQKFTHIFPHTETHSLAKEWAHIVDDPEVVYFVDNRHEMARFNAYGSALGIVENYTLPVVITHLEAGYLDVLPVSVLNAHHTVNYIIQTACTRANAPANSRVSGEALNMVQDFALRLLMSDGSYPEIGKALMSAISPLKVSAADFYMLKGQDLILLADVGHAPAMTRNPRISLEQPSPFSLPYNCNQPVWYDLNGRVQKDSDLKGDYVGIFPCCLKAQTYGFLRLIFSGSFNITPAIKLEIKRLMSMVARELETIKKIQQIENQKQFAYKLLGMASHDLRNPLSTLHFSTEILLRKEEIDQNDVKIYNRLANAVKDARSIVDSLLDFSGVHFNEAITINPQSTTVNEILNTVLDEFTVKAPSRNIEVTHAKELKGVWDVDKLKQVFANLIGNAHKYSPVDEPITVSLEGRNENVYIQVKNLKPIIPKDKLHTLFDPLIRTEQSRQSATEGWGIGLYIVRCLVELHQGRVWVDSHAATGTVFTVELPKISKSHNSQQKSSDSGIQLEQKLSPDLDNPIHYPLGMEDICCKTFFQLWTNLSVKGLPHPRSVPDDILHGFLHDLCWVSIVEEDNQILFSFDQVGGSLEHRLGKKITGLKINGEDEEGEFADVIASYHRVYQSKMPDFLYAKFRLDNSELQRFEKLVLPFSSNLDGKVTHLISIVRFYGMTH